MTKHKMTQARLDRMVGWIIQSSDEELDNLYESEDWEKEEELRKERDVILAIVLNKWKKTNEVTI
jgi:hypothetical protein